MILLADLSFVEATTTPFSRYTAPSETYYASSPVAAMFRGWLGGFGFRGELTSK